MNKNWLNFKIRFKNRRDFILYGSKLGCLHLGALTVNILILIYTAINWRELFREDNLWVLMAMIFSSIIWQGYSVVKDYYTYTRRTDYTNLQTIDPKAKGLIHEELKSIYSEPPVKFRKSKLLFSSEIDKLLQSDTPIQVRMGDIKQKNVQRYITSHRDMLLPFLNQRWHDMQNNNRNFYNEDKLCMASEFVKKGNTMHVEFCKGSYYNSYLTNFIYTKLLSHQSGFPLNAPRNILNYPIQRLDRATMSDHIGVSTLLITTDGHTLLLIQNDKALSSADQWTPSGTGSADLNDFREGLDFRETIKFAAERELCEETGISHEQIDKTIVIGFYRDITRGGKPEFCCLTLLNVDSVHLVINPNIEEQRDDFELFKIINNNQLCGSDFDSFSKRCTLDHSVDGRPSLALNMCYTILCKYYGDQRNKIVTIE